MLLLIEWPHYLKLCWRELDLERLAALFIDKTKHRMEFVHAMLCYLKRSRSLLSELAESETSTSIG